jgi:hypothetical protein
MDMPSGLAYDRNHARLFAVDGNNSRVLVFDVSAQDLKNGMEATAVLGQPDFSTGDEVRLDTDHVSEDAARRHMRMPDGIAYDAANDRLYVGDKGNDRVLIFDAAPAQLRSGMAATGVVGQKDFTSRIGGSDARSTRACVRQRASTAVRHRFVLGQAIGFRLT